MTEAENEKWEAFKKRSEEGHRKFWEQRTSTLKTDSKREHKGVYYLALATISILGGVAGMVYGLIGQDWVQKPYVVMGGVLVLFGVSIVIGGFGKVRE